MSDHCTDLILAIAESPFDYSAQVVYSNPTNEVIIHIPYDEALEIDYRHFDANGIVPRFEFGFGLSYTYVSSLPSLLSLSFDPLPPLPPPPLPPPPLDIPPPPLDTVRN